jgi:hypothetical protein
MYFIKFQIRLQYKSMKSILILIHLSYYFLGISELFFMKTMSQTIALSNLFLYFFKI